MALHLSSQSVLFYTNKDHAEHVYKKTVTVSAKSISELVVFFSRKKTSEISQTRFEQTNRPVIYAYCASSLVRETICACRAAFSSCIRACRAVCSSWNRFCRASFSTSTSAEQSTSYLQTSGYKNKPVQDKLILTLLLMGKFEQLFRERCPLCRQLVLLDLICFQLPFEEVVLRLEILVLFGDWSYGLEAPFLVLIRLFNALTDNKTTDVDKALSSNLR